jgi:hypothetical protein
MGAPRWQQASFQVRHERIWSFGLCRKEHLGHKIKRTHLPPTVRVGRDPATNIRLQSSGRTVDMTGEPTYIELGVRDAEAATTFYGRLFGWIPAGPGQVDTATLSIGIHGGDEGSHFEVFFAVDDLDTSIEKVGALGGRLVSEINDTPGFGRWIECADDQGVRFGLRQPS